MLQRCAKRFGAVAKLGVAGLLAAGLAACTQTVAPPPTAVDLPKQIVVAPPPIDVPCEITRTCPPKPKPPAPFNVMGAVLGDACPKADSLLAPFASCRGGKIMSVRLEIPAFGAAAKNAVFTRALEKYGRPTEDRHGGIPMRMKVMLPDWALDQTPPDLRAYNGKRSMFWWIDETAAHYLSLLETDKAVLIHLEKLQPQVRAKFDRDAAAREKLEDKGKALTEAF